MLAQLRIRQIIVHSMGGMISQSKRNALAIVLERVGLTSDQDPPIRLAPWLLREKGKDLPALAVFSDSEFWVELALPSGDSLFMQVFLWNRNSTEPEIAAIMLAGTANQFQFRHLRKPDEIAAIKDLLTLATERPSRMVDVPREGIFRIIGPFRAPTTAESNTSIWDI